jgi:hypothetical protein
MADVVGSAPRTLRHETARLRRRRDDVWIAATALVAAMLALPLAQTSWHGPEVAATLAVAATAMFAGQRWSIAVIVIAELMLLPTIWPRAFLPDADLVVRLAALGSLFALVPGVLAMRRAAAALVLVTGRPRTRETCRRFHIALLLIAVIATCLPLL